MKSRDKVLRQTNECKTVEILPELAEIEEQINYIIFVQHPEFINYDNGNVRCKILKRYYQLINIDKKNKLYVIDTSYKDEKSIITVPIIYTKYVCSSYKQLSNEYIQYFDLV